MQSAHLLLIRKDDALRCRTSITFGRVTIIREDLPFKVPPRIASAGAVLDLARSKARTGTTVIAVLHDLNLAARFPDRIVAMRKGEIACGGDATTSISADIMAQVFSVSATIRQTDHMLPFVLARAMTVLDRG